MKTKMSDLRMIHLPGFGAERYCAKGKHQPCQGGKLGFCRGFRYRDAQVLRLGRAGAAGASALAIASSQGVFKLGA